MTSEKNDWGPYGSVQDHPDQLKHDKELTDADIEAIAAAMKSPHYRQFIESLENVEDELGLGEDLQSMEPGKLTPEELAHLRAFYPVPKPEEGDANRLHIKRNRNKLRDE
jgi:hypothetical protein